MSKISIIALREFSTRVRKKSFVIMTALGPLLFAMVLIIPVWLKMPQGKSGKSIYVCDPGNIFDGRLQNDQWVFTYTSQTLPQAKTRFIQGDYQALLYLSPAFVDGRFNIILFSKEQIPVHEKIQLEKFIHSERIEMMIERLKSENKLPPEIGVKVKINNQPIFGKFEKNNENPLLSAAGLMMGVLIYIFILLYGVQVMRGVVEEKTNRIVEVLICTVKPFQLMAGKILGIGMVSLLQFFIWISMSVVLSVIASARYSGALELFGDKNLDATLHTTRDVAQSLEVNAMLNYANDLHLLPILAAFIYYFICGYLVYSSLFAAIGAATDSDTDVQQFMLPVTIPLFFCFMVIGSVLDHPQSNMAITLSMIPFTSPIIMMARVPFGVPWPQLLVSMLLLFSTIIIIAWLAGRIYRIGILSYGKKATYKELVQWIFSKG